MAGSKIKEIYEVAVRMEEDGIRFYAEASEKTSHPFGKRIFLSLAEDERRHLKVLEEVFRGVDISKAEKNLPTDTPRKRLRTVFEDLKGKVSERLESNPDEIDAINLALEIEEKGFKLYRKTAEEATDNEERRLLERLASEENDHYTVLQNTLSYIQDTGHWFLWEERAILNGG